jgi:hypothetical protein
MELLKQRESGNAVEGNPNPFDQSDASQTVTVVSGPYAQAVLIGSEGMTIRELRRRNAARLDLDSAAVAVVDGREVSEETIIHAGALVMFTKRAGEKGAFK